MGCKLTRPSPSLLAPTFGLFVAVLTVGSVYASGETPKRDAADERRSKLESLTAEQKEELQRKKEYFDSLSPEEQQKLRSLHSSIAGADDSKTLRCVLNRYNEWLKTLSAAERAELLTLPPDDRIKRIKELQAKQEQDRFRQYVGQSAAQLSDADREVIHDWLQEYLDQRQDEIYADMSSDSRERFQKISDPSARRRALIGWLLWRRRFPTPGPEEIETLIPRLSADSQRHLAEAKTPEDKQRLARAWVMAAVFSKTFPQPTDAERQKIFASLPAKERERLEQMEPDQMRRELNRMHHAEQFGKNREGGVGPGWGAPPGRFGPGPRGNDRPDGGRGPFNRDGRSAGERSSRPSPDKK